MSNCEEKQIEGQSPLISIILPIYNGENYLKQTLKMILNSNYKNIEVLCIDDGSTDLSSAICKEYQEKDSRVRYYKKANGGVAEARNKGLELASGDFICFSDQDDIIHRDFYEVMIQDAIRTKSDMIISNIGHYIQNKEIPTNTITKSKKLSIEEKNSLLKWLIIDSAIDKKPIDTISRTVWNVMFSRKLIQDNGIKFERIIANEDDWLFLISCMKQSELVYLEKKSLYSWRIHTNQTTQNPKYIDDYSEKRKQLRKIIDVYMENIELTERELLNYNINYIVRVIFIGLRNAAISVESKCCDKKQSVDNIMELHDSLKMYIEIVPKELLKKECKEKYGIFNMYMMSMVIRKKYATAISLKRSWMFLRKGYYKLKK